jgi:hypothetical protein
MGDGSRGPGRPTAPDEVWDAVRDDYLAGMTAADACRKHGVGMSALRARSARDGWRRKDQPWSDALPEDDPGRVLEDRVNGDFEAIGFLDLSDVARSRMILGVLRNDARAAEEWRKVMITMLDMELDRLDLNNNEAEARRRYPELFPDDSHAFSNP